MSELIELIKTGSAFPIEYVMALMAFAVIGLAAFAIYAVHSIAKRRDSDAKAAPLGDDAKNG